MSNQPMRKQVEDYIVDLQDRIVTALEGLDPNAPKFKRDAWTRAQGGRGQSCVFGMPDASDSAATDARGSVLEKAGVNISIVHGVLPPAAIKQMRADHSSIPFDPASQSSLPFFAAGLSLVIHPRNPHAPTSHANYRYFEVTEPAGPGEEPGKGKVLAWWFGGGCDLTPSYLYDEDAVHFHKVIKDACDPHGETIYPSFKHWCDEYFWLPHRNEARGVGGIFFDDLCDQPHPRLRDDQLRPRTADDLFKFVKSCGDAFVPGYVPIVAKRKDTPSTPHQRRWQLLRRGRYVEFNLVYDRGTKFGLMTPGARIESILMSLPETARWEYMSELGTDENTEEGRLMQVIKNPKSWV
ncbi:hypothetical protein EIP86_000929 [Pleurotus ostreatoroseus]|nr:hypothetical protein EIP86_000929 [Pleurotus ostreatoroseus]